MIQESAIQGALIAFASAWLLVWMLKPVAFSWSLLDYPRSIRKSHGGPTPVTGGLAMTAAAVVGGFLVWELGGVGMPGCSCRFAVATALKMNLKNAGIYVAETHAPTSANNSTTIERDLTILIFPTPWQTPYAEGNASHQERRTQHTYCAPL